MNAQPAGLLTARAAGIACHTLWRRSITVTAIRGADLVRAPAARAGR